MKNEAHALATLCAHAGSTSCQKGQNAPVMQAISQTTMFHLGDSAEAEEIFSGARAGHAYTRFSNPNAESLAGVIAELEGGSGALVTSSGNAAMLCAITAAMAGRNGPLVTHGDIYGGSFELIKILREVYRVPVEVIDSQDNAAWEKALPKAGAVLVETPSNPLLKLRDLAKISAILRENGAPLIVDNTVATPFNQSPFAHGADWVVHSTSKYLNGHSDAIGGCVVKRETLSARDRNIHKNLGGTVNAIDAWLILRGLRTFSMRMEKHNANGAALAAWLQNRLEVSAVHYPGLADHPQTELFSRQMRHGGALLSFELKGGKEAACGLIDRLRLIVHAVSLGGMESLVSRPAMASHRGMGSEARAEAGISEGLIRLSVGTEDLNDLKADLAQAFGE